jgi:FlaA1/EpsC-like NDP-sugar epimerase
MVLRHPRKGILGVKTISIILGVMALFLLLAIHVLPASKSLAPRTADVSLCESVPAPIPLIIFWLTGVTTVGLGRTMLRRLHVGQTLVSRSRNHPGESLCNRAVLLGAGPQASRIIRGTSEDPQPRYDIIGILDDCRPQGTYIDEIPVIGPMSTLTRLLAERAVDKVIVADASIDGFRDYVIECRRQKLRVKVVPGLEDFLLRRAPCAENRGGYQDREDQQVR